MVDYKTITGLVKGVASPQVYHQSFHGRMLVPKYITRLVIADSITSLAWRTHSLQGCLHPLPWRIISPQLYHQFCHLHFQLVPFTTKVVSFIATKRDHMRYRLAVGRVWFPTGFPVSTRYSRFFQVRR